MKGFKATYNMECNSLTYEVGKTYKIDNIEICSHGFHFCEKMKDVLNYYSYNEDFILLEVESLGNHITKGDKTVTDELKVLRIIPKEEYEFNIPINEYDTNGNMTHHKSPNGYEWWKEYDANGNSIYYKDSDGYEWWKEYDTNGNEINYKDSDGYECWTEYDTNGKLIHYKNSKGIEWWKEYDTNGNEIHYKNSQGTEWCRGYDTNGNMIYYKDSNKEWRITIN